MTNPAASQKSPREYVQSLTRVNNNARGNCMYEAYAISLMSYLRRENKTDLALELFAKLELQEEDIKRLLDMIPWERSLAFDANELQSIQSILMQPLRNFAADSVLAEFLNDSRAASVATAFRYGLDHYVLNQMKMDSQYVALSELLANEKNNFDNPIFKDAELYRVEGIKERLASLAKENLGIIMIAFNKQWDMYQDQLKSNPDAKPDWPEPDDLSRCSLKKALYDYMMAGYVDELLTDDNSAILNLYVTTRIRKSFVWGTEETLHTLHNALINVSKKRNEEGQVEVVSAVSMRLGVCVGKTPAFFGENPELVLNHENGNHWTSLLNHVPEPGERIKEILRVLDKKINEELISQTKDPRYNCVTELQRNVAQFAADNELLGKPSELNLKNFLKKAIQAVDEALPKLGNTWGECFKNVLKVIANVVLAFVTLGQVRPSRYYDSGKNAFFKGAQSLQEDLKTLEKNLNSKASEPAPGPK
jgi:hypothetical protein